MAKLTSLQTKSNLIPATAFHQLPYWKILNADDQKKVESDSQSLARAIFHEGASKLEQGRYLTDLQKTLEPYRCFVRHLKNFKMSQKTAYRYIAYFNNAKKRYPEAVLQAILARGVDAIGDSDEQPYGKYTPVIKALPVPKTSDKYQIEEWVNKVEDKYKKYRSDLRNDLPVTFGRGLPSPEVSMKAAFRFVRMKMKLVPKNHQQKWLRELTGHLLAELGGSPTITVTANEAPEEFRRGPGKPRQEKAAVS